MPPSVPDNDDLSTQDTPNTDVPSNTQSTSQLLNQLLSTVTRIEAIVNRGEDENRALELEVNQLRSDNEAIRSELRRVQENNGGRFYLFPRLPTEVRHMIWQ